jgi:hypothetical protein
VNTSASVDGDNVLSTSCFANLTNYSTLSTHYSHSFNESGGSFSNEYIDQSVDNTTYAPSVAYYSTAWANFSIGWTNSYVVSRGWTSVSVPGSAEGIAIANGYIDDDDSDDLSTGVYEYTGVGMSGNVYIKIDPD